MGTITTPDGIEILFKDWCPPAGQPLVFSHGWPLSADDWDTRMVFSQADTINADPLAFIQS